MPERIRNYAAEIALGLATVAFSGMGIFLVQWGTAQADVDHLKDEIVKHEQRLDEAGRIRDAIREDIHKIDKRGERLEVMLEGVANRLGVPPPPNNGR